MEKKIENKEVKYLVPTHREPIAVPPMKYDELVRQSERLGVIERMIDDAEARGYGMLDISTLKLVMGVYPSEPTIIPAHEDKEAEEVGEDA